MAVEELMLTNIFTWRSRFSLVVFDALAEESICPEDDCSKETLSENARPCTDTGSGTAEDGNRRIHAFP